MRVQATDFLRSTKEQNTAFIDRCIALKYCTRPRRMEDWNPVPDDKPPRHVHQWKDDYCLVPGCTSSRTAMFQHPEPTEPLNEAVKAKIISL